MTCISVSSFLRFRHLGTLETSSEKSHRDARAFKLSILSASTRSSQTTPYQTPKFAVRRPRRGPGGGRREEGVGLLLRVHATRRRRAPEQVLREHVAGGGRGRAPGRRRGPAFRDKFGGKKNERNFFLKKTAMCLLRNSEWSRVQIPRCGTVSIRSNASLSRGTR